MAADLAVQVRVHYVVACNQERHMFKVAGMIPTERTVELLTQLAPFCLFTEMATQFLPSEVLLMAQFTPPR